MYSSVNGYNVCNRDEVIPEGSFLLVDAFGFLFQLILNHHDLDAIYGGNYNEMDLIIRQRVTELQDEMKLRLQFYLDGSMYVVKTTENKERVFKRDSKW